MTSKCLACKEGVSEKKYCKKNPNTNGCSGKGGDGSNKQKWKQVCDDVKQLQAKHPDTTKNDVKKYLKKDHSMSKKEIGKFLNKFCKLEYEHEEKEDNFNCKCYLDRYPNLRDEFRNNCAR